METSIGEIITATYQYLDYNVWTDWVPIATSSPLVEFTLSLNNKKILLDYEIYELLNIHYSDDPNFLQLASVLNSSFINSISENDTAKIEEFQILWDAMVDLARTGFAKTDFDPGDASPYAKDAWCNGNSITLLNNLPEHCVPVVIEYASKNFVLNGSSDRFIQWKCELTSSNTGLTPIIKGFTANYTLNFYDQVTSEFPGLFRRI
jgi:hypothetical protein